MLPILKPKIIMTQSTFIHLCWQQFNFSNSKFIAFTNFSNYMIWIFFPMKIYFIKINENTSLGRFPWRFLEDFTLGGKPKFLS